MTEPDGLAQRFEDHRARLRTIAYRMLGSMTEADDAVQETWLRLSRSDPTGVDNLGRWLTTVIGSVCLDMLRSRASRREEPPDAQVAEPALSPAEHADPEQEELVADSVGLALLVVLDRLAPAERVAFVLHDMFAVPFDEIAPILGRSSAATKQLATRARHRVQGASSAADADPARRREIVKAFLTAAHDGDLAGLLAVLAPAVVLRADDVAVQAGAVSEIRGAAAVADTFVGRARAARPALVDGDAGAVWLRRGEPQMVVGFTIIDGKIAEIDIFADPDHVGSLDVKVLDG